MEIIPSSAIQLDWLSIVRAGFGFIGGTDRGSGAGLLPHVQLLNPAGSGRTALVRRVFVSTDSTQQVDLRRHDTPLTNLVISVFNLDLSGATGVCTVRDQTNGVALGTALITKFAGANTQLEFLKEGWLQMGPGEAIVCLGRIGTSTISAAFELAELVN